MKILEATNGCYNLNSVPHIQCVVDEEVNKWAVKLWVGTMCLRTYDFDTEDDAVRFAYHLWNGIKWFLRGKEDWVDLKLLVHEAMERVVKSPTRKDAE